MRLACSPTDFQVNRPRGEGTDVPNSGDMIPARTKTTHSSDRNRMIYPPITHLLPVTGNASDIFAG